MRNLPGATAGADDGEAWISSGNNLGLVIRIFGMLGTRWTGATDRTWNTASAETAYGSSNSQVNWMGTLNNTLYITGVQFEIGDVATPFEHRTYGEDEKDCERYYQVVDVYFSTGSYTWAYHYYEPFEFRTAMRANPTLDKSTASGGTGTATTTDSGNTTHNGLVLIAATQYAANCRGGSTNSFAYMNARGHFKAEI